MNCCLEKFKVSNKLFTPEIDMLRIKSKEFLHRTQSSSCPRKCNLTLEEELIRTTAELEFTKTEINY